MFSCLVNALKSDPVDNGVVCDFFDMCANITSNINDQSIKHNELKFEQLINELNLDDEIAELKEFYSPDELTLFLSDIG